MCVCVCVKCTRAFMGEGYVCACKHTHVCVNDVYVYVCVRMARAVSVCGHVYEGGGVCKICRG